MIVTVARDGSVTTRDETVDERTVRVAAALTAKVNIDKSKANSDRMALLAKRAARYARDPVANASDKLTDRLIHELLARVVLSVATDDQ